MRYETPPEYKFELHHSRSRFKNDAEDVLYGITAAVSSIDSCPKKEFDGRLDDLIRDLPGNFAYTEKTIHNKRTEIPSLFGLVSHHKNGDVSATNNAIMLAKNGDLAEFFKYFLYTFQYPGGHMKSHKIAEAIQQGIKFNPARYILSLLRRGKEIEGRDFWISKGEATHCMLNDLRVTRDGWSVDEVIRLILENRERRAEYDCTQDVIRSAGDILDYMEYANLLTYHGGRFYLDDGETEVADYMIEKPTSFDGFDAFYDKHEDIQAHDVGKQRTNWTRYVNDYVGKLKFASDISGPEEGGALTSDTFRSDMGHIVPEDISISQAIEQGAIDGDDLQKNQVGNFGEELVFQHECEALRRAGKKELIGHVKRLPTRLWMGYDVKSRTVGENFKCIEVKTTYSHSTLSGLTFTMTPNEWYMANQFGDMYYVYFLRLRRPLQGTEQKLQVFRNPSHLLATRKINIKTGKAITVTVKNSDVGTEERLLKWNS